MSQRAEKNSGAVLFFVRGVLIFILNVIIYGLVILGIVYACKGTYSFAHEVFGDVMAEDPPGRDIVFTIKDFEDPLTISRNLEEYGIVSNAYSFYIRFKLSLGDNIVVVAGDHNLNTNMTYEEILNEILKGVSG